MGAAEIRAALMAYEPHDLSTIAAVESHDHDDGTLFAVTVRRPGEADLVLHTQLPRGAADVPGFDAAGWARLVMDHLLMSHARHHGRAAAMAVATAPWEGGP